MSLVVLALAYLVGSVPTRVLMGRLVAGGRPDGGFGFALATILVDAVKGALPVVLAHRLTALAGFDAVAAVAVVLGDAFPITLRFAGAKGVATAFGALSVLTPSAAPWILAVFLFAFGLDRHVSFASLLAAMAAPVAVSIHGYPIEYLAAALLMGAIIVARHRDNLRRLREGTEPRFALPKRQAPPVN